MGRMICRAYVGRRILGIERSSAGTWEKRGKRLPWLAAVRVKSAGHDVWASALVVGPLAFWLSDAAPFFKPTLRFEWIGLAPPSERSDEDGPAQDEPKEAGQ